MKTKYMILGLSLTCLSLYGQTETAHFSIKEFEHSTLLQVKNFQMLPRSQSSDPYYDFKNYEELLRIQNDLFHTLFESILPGNKEVLDKVTYCFFLDKDLKVYGFDISFPTQQKEQMLEWEKPLYQFGEEFKKIDLSLFLRPYSKNLFEGSIYYILFSHMKGMSEGKRYYPE